MSPGWNREPKPPPPPKFHTIGTQMGAANYTRHSPSAGTLTKIDELQYKVVNTIERIDSARPVEPRTKYEKIMLIQFICKFIEEHKCDLTTAVTRAVEVFCWNRKDVFDVFNSHLNDENQCKLSKTKVVSPRLLAICVPTVTNPNDE